MSGQTEVAEKPNEITAIPELPALWIFRGAS